MEAYLWVFVNFEQNDWARLLPMAQFAYNNAKNASTSHMLFKLNYNYYLWILYKKKVDPHPKSKSVDKLSAELRKLMIVCCENLYYTQKLQKRAHNKGVKPKSFDLDDKKWLNSKYIKAKHYRKLEAKFFGPFQVLYPIEKQAYKLELSNKWRIHNVFYVSLLEQDMIKIGRVDENTTELDVSNDDRGKYKVEIIWDSAVYARNSESGHLLGHYYLVLWKRYLEEPASTV